MKKMMILMALVSATAAAGQSGGGQVLELHGINNGRTNACVNGGGTQDGLVIPDCNSLELRPVTQEASDSQLHMLSAPSGPIGISTAWTQVQVSGYGVPAGASYALLSAVNGCHGSYDSIVAATSPNPTASTASIPVAGFGAGGRQGVGGEGGGQAFVPIFNGSAWLAAGSSCEGVSVQVIGYQ